MLPAAAYVTLVAAALAGIAATWVVRAGARRAGIVSAPNPIVPQHTRPTAYLGGLGVALGAALTLLLLGFAGPHGGGFMPFNVRTSLVAPALLYLGLGLYDDLRPLRPAEKFGLQALAALVAVSLGVTCPLTGIRFIDSAIAFLWIVTLVNAVNLTDVCDGLVAGLTVVSSVFLAHVNPPDSVVCMVIAGACLGFLAFNRPPASIFLGDAGSLFLGYLLAAFTLLSIPQPQPWPDLPRIALMVGVPLFELCFLIVVRTRRGIAWWRGSPDHFALRLQAGGLTRWQTDLTAWSAAAVLWVPVLVLRRLSPAGQAVTIAAAAVFFAASWRALLRWEVRAA